MLPNVQKLLLQTFPLSLKVTELATLSRRRNLKKLTKQSYTFEKTVNQSCKNSTVVPKKSVNQVRKKATEKKERTCTFDKKRSES